MSADKRSVHTDALATLGMIIESGDRDAIHLAVEPVVAGETLYPGQHIGIESGKATSKAAKKLGIVDPFVVGRVEQGQMFWLIVYPRQITSLRHVWEHPDFTDVQDNKISAGSKEASEKWLREWCESTKDAPSYDDLLAVIAGVGEVSKASGDYGGDLWENQGEYLVVRGRDAHSDIPNAYQVKHHIEVVTGKQILSMPEYFSCSC